MQNPMLEATYVLDPQFVEKSSSDVKCTLELWKLAKKILQPASEAEWTEQQSKLALQLTKFRAMQQSSLELMGQAAAWTNLHKISALDWWAAWGMEVPELQKLAMKLVPLLIGSGPECRHTTIVDTGVVVVAAAARRWRWRYTSYTICTLYIHPARPAERVWSDTGRVITKDRNRLGIQKALNIVYVRTWLRRMVQKPSKEALEVFKAWESELFQKAVAASFGGDGQAVEIDSGSDSDSDNEVAITFIDSVEQWEQNAIDGKGPGPRINLTDVKKNKAMTFKLQTKYVPRLMTVPQFSPLEAEDLAQLHTSAPHIPGPYLPIPQV